MQLSANQTLLFIGDSITDCGRDRPLGARAGLGNGYVALVNAMLGAATPQDRIRVLNTGISGNRVTDLLDRWESDVIAHQPDWLSIMIGINDVWRQFDNDLAPDQVDIETYESVYRQLLEQTRPRLQGLVLISPFFIEPNRQEPVRQRMDAYGAVVARLAKDFDAVFVDAQAAFDQYLQHRSNQSLGWDRIHPNLTGHMVIARAFLQALNRLNGY